MRDLITADDLAEVLGITRNHVYRLARSGVAPAYMVGRYYRFDLARVLEAFDMQREEVTGPDQPGDDNDNAGQV
jgi:excisionase family DNA binding protein